jgi:aubergine-like protein
MFFYFKTIYIRGNVKFFYTEPNSNCYQNAPMGTVVDNTVTKRKINNIQDIEFSDFYLISQNTRQGTVSPSHFRILVNEFFPERPECLQILTYKLTHMYL